MSIVNPKKLIEVALPLDSINSAAAREKSIRHGHPSTLHLWWARRPLAAARAVIFSQLVHDPEDLWRCQNPGKIPNAQVKGHWVKTRNRLFSIIEELVKWENTTNKAVIDLAREEIRSSWIATCELNKTHPQSAELFNPDKMPGLHDPFAGGGAIPLEAQRLGVEAFASDLNPVAVLINRAMIDIPARFANCPPVRPESMYTKSGKLGIEEIWCGADGLAEDVRYYGAWMKDEAFKRIGNLYPPVNITGDLIKDRPDLECNLGKPLTVIAWIWARTVKSPNPAFAQVDVPLASTFILSSKSGKEAWVQPVIESAGYRFEVKIGKPPLAAKSGTKAARGANFRCLMSGTAIEPNYIKSEALAGRIGSRLMAIIAEGPNGRVYLPPIAIHEETAMTASVGEAAAAIHVPLADDPRNLWCLGYGLDHFDKLFSARQLVALSTLSDLAVAARERVYRDAIAAGRPDDDISLENGGKGARAISEAVGTYLAFLVGQVANHSSTICGWNHPNTQMRSVFSRQAVPMTWDYAESNVFSDSSGSFSNLFERQLKGFAALGYGIGGCAIQSDAQTQQLSSNRFVSTDPPYYDNITYADLSDFFYVWLRRTLRGVYTDLLSTISVPKAEELIASPYRHGSKEGAERFFLHGMAKALSNLAKISHPGAPITVYYAFKQSETESVGTKSTGWETFLAALINSGLAITGTWPMRTEKEGRSISYDTNALASSIIIVCRPRQSTAETISRRQFIRELNNTLPFALDAMTRESEGLHSPVAPVDLSQAIIGPGMAVFSKYAGVLEADGSPMSVRTALQLINRFLAEDDFDAETQFCIHWFDQYGWESGKFGEADTLARAKGTAVDVVKQSGVLHSAGGSVRLFKWAEYPCDWDPQADHRLPIWEVLHQLIRVFNADGESGAAAVFAAVQSKAEAARQLAYRLYTLCERKNWAEDARAYNEVVTSWSSIESAAAKEPAAIQRTLFDN